VVPCTASRVGRTATGGAASLKPNRTLSGLLFFGLTLGSSGPISASTCQEVPESHGATERPQVMSLKIYRTFMVVAEGQFGAGSGKENFILDTGTAPSIINERVARQLGLKTYPSIFTAVGKSIRAQTATILEIELGPMRACSLPVQVQDLSRLERDLGVPVAGILGMDVLSNSSFRLDYDKKEIEVGTISRDGIPVPVNSRTGLAVALVKIEGKPVRMLVDTGSDRVVLLGGNFPEAGWLALRNTSQSGSSLADQSVRVQVFSSPNIVFGGRSFTINRAYFVPAGSDPVFDALLGVRALGFHQLSYDQACETIFLQ
jgi:hypothetical protein